MLTRRNRRGTTYSDGSECEPAVPREADRYVSNFSYIEEILTITKEPENEAAGGGNLVVLRHDDGSMVPFKLS